MTTQTSTRLFNTRRVDHVIEVWDGIPDLMESELMLAVDQSLIPQLIATLKNVIGKHQ